MSSARKVGSLLRPDLLGLAFGALAGLVLLRGKWIGAILGAIAGYIAQQKLRSVIRSDARPDADSESGRSHSTHGVGGASGGANLSRSLATLDARLRLAAAIAAVDGSFDPAARDAARSWFAHDLACGKADLARVDAAIASIGEATAASLPAPRAAARALLEAGALPRRERSWTLFALFRVALARPLTARRDAALKDAALGLDLTTADYDELRGEFVVTPRGSASEADYRALDLEPGASQDAVREKYREAVRTYHPDRFQHLGEDFTRVAEERFKAIHSAYERITGSDSASDGATGDGGEGARARRRPTATRCPNCRKFTDAAERLCIRCGHEKLEGAEQGNAAAARVRCAFCSKRNAIPRNAPASVVSCAVCRVVLVK